MRGVRWAPVRASPHSASLPPFFLNGNLGHHRAESIWRLSVAKGERLCGWFFFPGPRGGHSSAPRPMDAGSLAIVTYVTKPLT